MFIDRPTAAAIWPTGFAPPASVSTTEDRVRPGSRVSVSRDGAACVGVPDRRCGRREYDTAAARVSIEVCGWGARRNLGCTDDYVGCGPVGQRDQTSVERRAQVVRCAPCVSERWVEAESTSSWSRRLESM